MARLVFRMIAGFGLLAIIATIYLRYELAQPGVSGVSAALAGEAPQGMFRAMLALHGVATAVLLPLTGALAGFVAALRGARVGPVAGWAGLAAALLLGLLHVLLAAAPDLVPPALGGATEGFGLLIWPSAEDLTLTVGLITCFVGAAALLAWGRWRSVASTVLMLISLAGLVLFLIPGLFQAAFFLIPASGLFILALTSLRQSPAPAFFLALGAAALTGSLVNLFWVVTGPAPDMAFGDSAHIAEQIHLLLGLFGLYTLLAALIAWTTPRLSVWVLPLLGLLVLVGHVASFWPRTLLILTGAPPDQIDWPWAFILWNAVSSAGTLLFLAALLVILLLIWLRRTR